MYGLYANQWDDSWTYEKEGSYVIVADPSPVSGSTTGAYQGYVGVFDSISDCVLAYQNGSLTLGSEYICDTYSDSIGYTCYANRFYVFKDWYRGSGYYSNIDIESFVSSPLYI